MESTNYTKILKYIVTYLCVSMLAIAAMLSFTSCDKEDPIIEENYPTVEQCENSNGSRAIVSIDTASIEIQSIDIPQADPSSPFTCMPAETPIEITLEATYKDYTTNYSSGAHPIYAHAIKRAIRLINYTTFSGETIDIDIELPKEYVPEDEYGQTTIEGLDFQIVQIQYQNIAHYFLIVYKEGKDEALPIELNRDKDACLQNFEIDLSRFHK